MAKAGFCSECNANVYVGEDGACVNGHPAGCVSNVYETSPAPPPMSPEPAPAPVVPQPVAPAPTAPPAAYAQPPAVPPTTPAPVPPGTPPPAKKSKALMITLIVLGVLLLCCVVAGIGAYVIFNSAKTSAERTACFANERTTEGAAATLIAGDQNAALPTGYSSLVAKLNAASLLSTDPKCPSGGIYTWTVNPDGTGGTVDCSVHGRYSTQPLPSP